jgi:hypothetical protein
VPKVLENVEKEFDSHTAKKSTKKLLSSNYAKTKIKKVANKIRETCEKI